MLQLNFTSLHSVLRDFYTLTRIRIVIFDTDFQELLAYPPEREGFCAMLRQDPEGEASCQNSDRLACQKCASKKALVRYCCHAGLTEAVVPIFDKSGVLAYVMFGQVISKEHYNEAKDQIKASYPQFHEAIDRLPVKSTEELQAAATVLQAITSYVMTNRWVTPGKSEFIRQLDQYIDGHLKQSIAVEDLCAAFHIGRSRLYEMSMDYLGCGLAEYIRSRRIFHAQAMLRESDLPVTDIACEAGFVDYNHFSRVFKKIAGCSAREYRKKNNDLCK